MLRATAYLPLGAILVLAAALRTFRLSENGFGREYYAAAVRSMLDSWHNVFFNSFDPGGFVTLDKPPLAIWMQALSAKLLGFSGFTVLLPQVIEGLAAVLLVYLIVSRAFGKRAALLAALFLALTPASVAIDRTNNTDSLLIFVLLLATWFGMRAAETGRLLYLCGAMLMIGIGFNVKMAAAIIFAPTIALVYFAFNREITFPRHVMHQAIAGVLLVVVALSWVTAFDLTPADKRPYVGSTKNNSMFELVLKHNGADRFAQFEFAPEKPDEARPVLYDESPTGPLRLFRALQAGQSAWLLPLALAGILLGSLAREKIRERRIAIAIWSGWLATYWIVFSAAGGPFHTYYLAALAPPLAALAGIGASEAWSRYRNNEAPRLLIPALIAVTALWQAWIAYGQAGANAPQWLLWTAIAAAFLAAAGAIIFERDIPRSRTAFALPLAALLTLPALSALSVVLFRPNVAAPVATLAVYGEKDTSDVLRANPRRMDFARNKLIAFLKERRGNEKFLVAVENAFVAGPIIIAGGDPVMTLGGYLGTDPILTPEKLARLAERGDVRFVMIGGFSLTKRNQPGEIALREWVQKNATRVDPALWSTAPQLAGRTFRVRLGGALTEMTYPVLFELPGKSAR